MISNSHRSQRRLVATLLCSAAWATSSAAFAQSSSPASATAVGQTEEAQADVKPEDEADDIQTITVEGRRSTGYRVDTTTSVTRFPVEIKDLPLSIQVIPAQVLTDQAAIDLSDAYRNVSGVRAENNGANTSNLETATVRGFRNFIVNRNGFATRSAGNLDLAIVETVDVLKGPSGISFGQVEPGGLVNYTTKRPRNTFFFGADVRAGSYDYYRGAADITGPIGSGPIFYRVSAAYANHGSFRRFVDTESFVLSPSIAFRPSDDFSVTVEGNYSELKAPFDAGIPFGPNGKPVGSIRSYYGEPSTRGRHMKDAYGTIDATWNLSEGLTLRAAYVHHEFNHNYEAVRPIGVTTIDGRAVLRRRYDDTKINTDEDQAFGILTWVAPVGAFTNTLSLAVDYRHTLLVQDPVANGSGVNLNIDILNPVYRPPGTPLYTTLTAFDYLEANKEYSFSIINILATANERLHLLFGARRAEAESSLFFAVQGSSAAILDSGFKGGAWTFQGGAIYKLLPQLSVYGSYSESFNAADLLFAPPPPGQTLKPVTGVQFEAGIKASLFDEALQLTSAVFEVTKKNIPLYVSAPDVPPNYYYYINGGKLRSRGFEVDLVGELSDDLSILASYAYTDGEVLVSDGLPPGTPFVNVPKHAGSLWLHYKREVDFFRDGDKIGFGAGVFYVGKRSGDTANTFQLPAQAPIDLALSYETTLSGGQGVLVRLNIRNLLNETYYSASTSLNSVAPGAPRSVIFSVGIKL